MTYTTPPPVRDPVESAHTYISAVLTPSWLVQIDRQDVVNWLSSPTDPEAPRILRGHPHQVPSADMLGLRDSLNAPDDPRKALIWSTARGALTSFLAGDTPGSKEQP